MINRLVIRFFSFDANYHKVNWSSMLHPIQSEWETSGASGGGRPWLCIYCRFSSWSFIQIKPMFQPNESFHKWMHWLQRPYYLEMFHSGAAPRLLSFGRTLESQENTPSLTTHTSDTCDKCVSLLFKSTAVYFLQRSVHRCPPPPRRLTVWVPYPGGGAVGHGHLLDDAQVARSGGRHLVVPGGQQTPVVAIVGWESHTHTHIIPSVKHHSMQVPSIKPLNTQRF